MITVIGASPYYVCDFGRDILVRQPVSGRDDVSETDVEILDRYIDELMALDDLLESLRSVTEQICR